MAFDCFLEIDGIPGESTDSKHTGWIELLSFSHGLSQTPGGGGRSATAGAGGRAEHQDMVIAKYLDKATPKIAEALNLGKPIKTVTIALHRATGEKEQYTEYIMDNVFITSQSINATPGGGDAVPMEQVTFNYSAIKLTYTELDHETQAVKGDIVWEADLAANT